MQKKSYTSPVTLVHLTRPFTKSYTSPVLCHTWSPPIFSPLLWQCLFSYIWLAWGVYTMARSAPQTIGIFNTRLRRMLTYDDKQLSYEQQKRKGQVTYADVCWRMLTYADVCWRMLTRSSRTSSRSARARWRMLTYADVCWCMLTYADVFWRMLTYADVCWRMLTYADVCWRMLPQKRKGQIAHCLYLSSTSH